MIDDQQPGKDHNLSHAEIAAAWELHQKLALRGLLKLWQRFGDLEIWPDTGLRHIAPIFPYGVKKSVTFDMAFMMRQGYVRFGALNDNCASPLHQAR